MNAGAGTSIFPNTGATETLAERAKSGVLWLGIVNIASKGTQMAVTIALAAFLTESDLGLVTVVVSLISVAAVMQTLAVFEFIACAKGDERITAGTTLTISLAASTALTVFGVAQSSWIAATLGVPSAANLVAIAALSLPFTAIGGVQMAVMHRALDFRSRLLPDAGSALLGALLRPHLARRARGRPGVAGNRAAGHRSAATDFRLRRRRTGAATVGSRCGDRCIPVDRHHRTGSDHRRPPRQRRLPDHFPCPGSGHR